MRSPTRPRASSELLRRLLRFAPAEQIAVAIERPSGLLVDTLVETDFQVVPIHPNALRASRPRYSAAGAKSDPGDAYILADLLRTDGPLFLAERVIARREEQRCEVLRNESPGKIDRSVLGQSIHTFESTPRSGFSLDVG